MSLPIGILAKFIKMVWEALQSFPVFIRDEACLSHRQGLIDCANSIRQLPLGAQGLENRTLELVVALPRLALTRLQHTLVGLSEDPEISVNITLPQYLTVRHPVHAFSSSWLLVAPKPVEAKQLAQQLSRLTLSSTVMRGLFSPKIRSPAAMSCFANRPLPATGDFFLSALFSAIFVEPESGWFGVPS